MEWILSSSVLILVVLLLRVLTQGKISMRLRYALWAIVLLRLLVPFSFGSTAVSIMNTAQQVPVVQEAEALRGIEHIERRESGTVEGYAKADILNDFPTVIAYEQSEEDFSRMNTLLSTREWLAVIWKAGTLAVLAVFLLSNLHFRRRLRKSRSRMELADFPLPVYVTEAVESPCLFGLFRPAVYVPPEVRDQPQTLHYALQHELTHFYQGDFLWSALRCLCLALHWFNPLVYLAVNQSRQDAELACDEGTIRRIGENQRMAYGNTLIDLTCAKPRPSALLYAATTMTGSKKNIRERVTFIAKRPKTLGLAVLAVLVLITAAVGCTFTGADRQEEQPEALPLTEEELRFFQEEFFSPNQPLTGQFLTSLYKRPEEINLLELFYNGTGLPGAISDEEMQTLLKTLPDGAPDTDCIKLPVKDLDTILLQYTGLTLKETEQLGLDQLTYLSDYAAYYAFHGDTNARPPVTFTAGVRQGDQVSLFYDDSFTGSGYKMVTLRETEAGWHFLSNRYAPIPTRPAGLPEGKEEALLSFPVKKLSTTLLGSGASHPVTPAEVVPLTPCTRQEWGELVTSFLYAGSGSEPSRNILVGVWPDGGIYACYVIHSNPPGEDTYQRFVRLCDPSQTPNFLANPEWISISAFTDLLGHDGFVLTADGLSRYYFFDDQGQLHLFYQTYGRLDQQYTQKDCTFVFDNGSGEDPVILIQQEDTLHQEHLSLFMANAMHAPFELTLTEVSADGVGLFHYYDNTLDPMRYCAARIYCDGTSLCLLKGDGKTYSDHAAADIKVPEAVLTAAKSAAQARYDGLKAGKDAEIGPLDDWRISALRLEQSLFMDGKSVEVYVPSVEFHASAPEEMILAGGSYLTEDNWLALDDGYFDQPLLLAFAVEGDRYTPFTGSLEAHQAELLG